MTSGKKICVLGAGIVGIMTAVSLQKRGHAVILIDRNEPANGCSFGNAGYIATDEFWPMARRQILENVPSMLFKPMAPLSIRWADSIGLLPWFIKFAYACRQEQVRDGADILFALLDRTKTLWPRRFSEFGLSNMLKRRGMLKIYEGEHSYFKGGAERKIQTDYGIKFETLEGSALRERVNGLSESVTHGVFFDDGMHVIDPFKTAQAFFEVFLKNGGEFKQAYILGLKRNGTSIVGVETREQLDLGPINSFVVACGLQSRTILGTLGVPLPLIAERGYHVNLEEKASFDMPITSADRGFIMTPMANGLRLAGTVEFSRPNAHPNWKRADILVKNARQLLPNASITPSSRWMGERPTLPDYLPAISNIPNITNGYVNCGHQHLGLTLSAVSGELIADMIDQRKPSFSIDALNANRF